jgi:hypothetical protein
VSRTIAEREISRYYLLEQMEAISRSRDLIAGGCDVIFSGGWEIAGDPSFWTISRYSVAEHCDGITTVQLDIQSNLGQLIEIEGHKLASEPQNLRLAPTSIYSHLGNYRPPQPPPAPPVPAICQNCRLLFAETSGGIYLHCAAKPFGLNAETCADHEQKPPDDDLREHDRAARIDQIYREIGREIGGIYRLPFR